MPPPAQLGGMGERCKLPHWGAPEALLFVQLLCSKAIRNLITFHEKIYTVDLNLLRNVIKVLYFKGFTEMF